MALPNYVNEVEAARRKYPAAWAAAHFGGPDTEDFIRLLAADLNRLDPNVGLNGKRGNPNDISDDALAVFAPDGDVTDRTGRKMFIVDCIAGAGGPNPSPAWQSVGGPSPGAWVQPSAVPTPGPTPPPQPTGVPYRPYPPDESLWDAAGRQIEADYKRAGRPGLDAQSVRWTARIVWDATMGEAPPPSGRILTLEQSVAKHRGEWLAILGIPA